MIPVDSTGYPLHHATWQDKRSLPQTEPSVDALSFDGIYRKTGLRPNPYFPDVMWFKQEDPATYAGAAKLIGVQDYVIYLLTGHFVTDWTQAARTMLLDINTFQWDDELLAASASTSTSCPTCCRRGIRRGGLRRSIAKSVNLPEGLPVIIGGGDQQCAALALNVLSAGRPRPTPAPDRSPSPTPTSRRTTPSSGAVQRLRDPGKWITEAGIFNSGAILRWFRELLGGEPGRRTTPRWTPRRPPGQRRRHAAALKAARRRTGTRWPRACSSTCPSARPAATWCGRSWKASASGSPRTCASWSP